MGLLSLRNLKIADKLLLLFIHIGLVFVVSVIFDFRSLVEGSSYLLVPVLILYYWYKARKWFLPMVLTLMLFYVRNIFLLIDFSEHAMIILTSLGLSLLILFVFAVTGFQRAKIYTVEIFSLAIMYGFLGFLFFSISEIVPMVVPTYKWVVWTFLLVLILFMAFTFTGYLVKSHYASLWLMLAAASILISELSLFFRLYVMSNVSLDIFFPLFHVMALFSMVQYALHRRPSAKVPYF